MQIRNNRTINEKEVKRPDYCKKTKKKQQKDDRMLNLMVNDLGFISTIMKNIGTMDRAKEFLEIHAINNSTPKLKKFYILNVWNNQIVTY